MVRHIHIDHVLCQELGERLVCHGLGTIVIMLSFVLVFHDVYCQLAWVALRFLMVVE